MKWTPTARKAAIMWRVNKCGSADFKDVGKEFSKRVTVKEVENDSKHTTRNRDI